MLHPYVTFATLQEPTRNPSLQQAEFPPLGSRTWWLVSSWLERLVDMHR